MIKGAWTSEYFYTYAKHREYVSAHKTYARLERFGA